MRKTRFLPDPGGTLILLLLCALMLSAAAAGYYLVDRGTGYRMPGEPSHITLALKRG